MAKGRFKIKGTKDFLVLAVAMVFLCLWSVRDAWFPTRKTLEKHPQRIEVAFEVPGVVKSTVRVGEVIEGSRVLASLHDSRYQKALETAEVEFEAAKEVKSDDVEEKLNVLLKAREDLKACRLLNTEIEIKDSHGEDSFLKGEVLDVMVKPATRVEAGEAVLTVNPKDGFYAFNKTLAVLSFLGAIFAFIFHGIASR